MSVMVSWVTCLSTAYATTYIQVTIKENMKAPHYWTFMCEIRRWPMDSSHKGPVKQRAYLCHCLFMDLCRWGCVSISHERICKKTNCCHWLSSVTAFAGCTLQWHIIKWYMMFVVSLHNQVDFWSSITIDSNHNKWAVSFEVPCWLQMPWYYLTELD